MKKVKFFFYILTIFLFVFSIGLFAQTNLVRIAIINFKANDDITQTQADRFTELVRVIFTNKGIWDVVTPSEADKYFKQKQIYSITDKVITSIEYDEKFGAKFILYGNLYRDKNNKKQITIVAKIYDVKNKKLLLGVLYNIDENRMLDISKNAPVYTFVDKIEEQIFNSLGKKKPAYKEKPEKFIVDALIGINYPLFDVLYDPTINFYSGSTLLGAYSNYSSSGNLGINFNLNVKWKFFSILTFNLGIMAYETQTNFGNEIWSGDNAISTGIGIALGTFYLDIQAGLFSIGANVGGYQYSLLGSLSKDLLIESSFIDFKNFSYIYIANIQYRFSDFVAKLKGGYIVLSLYNGHSKDEINSGVLGENDIINGYGYLFDLKVIYLFSKVFGIAINSHMIYYNYSIPYSILSNAGITSYPDGIDVNGYKLAFSVLLYVKTGF